MDPFVTGLLTSLTYDALKEGAAAVREQSLTERIDAAAESVADEHEDLEASDLTDVWESDAVGDHVERFESHGEPLPATELSAVLADQAVELHLDADPETVVDDFLTAIWDEVAEDAVFWRKVALRSIKSGNQRIEAVQEAVESLREDHPEAPLTSPEDLRKEIERSNEQGFDWLTTEDFENGRVDEDYCWRREFTLTEIRKGYAIERRLPTDEGTTLTERVMDELSDGGNAVLLGSPGAGKTTATRQVLSEWEEQTDGGTVLYRDPDEQRPLDASELEAVIRTTRQDGPVLVAVDDAVRRLTYPIYEVIGEFETATDVSFLLNSRENEWERVGGGSIESFDPAAFDRDVTDVRNESLTPVYMPPLDEREVERYVENYYEVTKREWIDFDPAVLLDRIRGTDGDDSETPGSVERQATGVSPMLLLSYEVPVWEESIERTTEDDVPALIDNVRDVRDFVTSPDRGEWTDLDSDRERKLLERIALATNVLNAAEMGIPEEHLLAFGRNGEEFSAIEELLRELRGALVFAKEDGLYETHHPYWSMQYLSEHLRTASDANARDEFEACVNGLFQLFDSESLRERLADRLQGSDLLRRLEDNLQGFANELTESVFGIGERRPELAPLFGTTEYSDIELPEACSPRARIETVYSRVKTYRGVGDSDQELREIEQARQLADELGVDSEYVTGMDYVRRGHYELRQGNFTSAREEYQKALELAQENENRAGEAGSLTNLGVVAEQQGKLAEAKQYHEESLAINREIGDRAGEAKALGNLGVVARQQGKLAEAKQYHEESLAIFSEIGDRAGEKKESQRSRTDRTTTGEVRRGETVPRTESRH